KFYKAGWTSSIKLCKSFWMSAVVTLMGLLGAALCVIGVVLLYAAGDYIATKGLVQTLKSAGAFVGILGVLFLISFGVAILAKKSRALSIILTVFAFVV